MVISNVEAEWLSIFSWGFFASTVVLGTKYSFFFYLLSSKGTKLVFLTDSGDLALLLIDDDTKGSTKCSQDFISKLSSFDNSQDDSISLILVKSQ